MVGITGKLGTTIVSIVTGVVALTVVTLAIVVFLSPQHSLMPPATPAATVAVAAPLPAASATNAGPGITGAVTAAWVSKTASATGIPHTALQAYAAATLVVAAQDATCGLSWNTLAAIGWVESRHGQIHGGTIDASGLVTPPIYGVALDGNGVALVPDSDGGAIDGDPTGDRAVGPMQFLPSSWRNWRVDASGDGVEDVQNIFDASFAAAHYLCRAGGNLRTHEGWRTAVLAYNGSSQYLQDVINAANRYAAEARTV
ncbi:MAG: lytic transglycosylase domain-containing protein [Lacisediminihabitans sp.]